MKRRGAARGEEERSRRAACADRIRKVKVSSGASSASVECRPGGAAASGGTAQTRRSGIGARAAAAGRRRGDSVTSVLATKTKGCSSGKGQSARGLLPPGRRQKMRPRERPPPHVSPLGVGASAPAERRDVRRSESAGVGGPFFRRLIPGRRAVCALRFSNCSFSKCRFSNCTKGADAFRNVALATVAQQLEVTPTALPVQEALPSAGHSASPKELTTPKGENS